MKYLLTILLAATLIQADNKNCLYKQVEHIKNVGAIKQPDGETVIFSIWKIGDQCYLVDNTLPSSWGMAWTPCPPDIITV